MNLGEEYTEVKCTHDIISTGTWYPYGINNDINKDHFLFIYVFIYLFENPVIRLE